MQVNLETADLEPLVRKVVSEVVARLREDETKLGDKLAIPEAEAAALLSMEQWQLRDERRDKRITASVVRGGKIVYSRADLLAYLERRRWPVEKRGA